MGIAHRETTLLLLALLAPGPARAQGQPGAPLLALTVTDSSLRGPATFTAGVVTIQVTNRGHGVHLIQLLGIGTGQTAEGARAFIMANDGQPPGTALTVGVGPVEGGQTTAAVLKLDPGGYLLVDRLPDARGRPNYRAGVTMPIEVRGTARRDAPNVPAVAGLMLSNRFRFGTLIKTGNTWTQSENRDRNTQLRPGLQTIRIESFISGLHSVVLAKGGPEVMRQYVAWRDGDRATPPPGLVGGVGGVIGLMFKNRSFIQARLTPGGYILFCPEPHSAGPGYQIGEFAQFVVR